MGEGTGGASNLGVAEVFMVSKVLELLALGSGGNVGVFLNMVYVIKKGEGLESKGLQSVLVGEGNYE